MDEIDALIAGLRAAPTREAARAELIQRAKSASVREHLSSVKKGELLEVQWEIDEVLDATAPPPVKAAAAPPPPPPPPPAEKPDPNRPLKASDLNVVYDDPRGLMLHKSKVGDRWFATQVDPRTGQPQTFELHPQEIAQLKQQLSGSPYWVVGGGGLKPAAAPPAPEPKR